MVETEDTRYSFNDDILGGIKAAIERGEDLKLAMMSFYNAGYAKKEIEDAARQYILEKRERESNGSPMDVSGIKGITDNAKTKDEKGEKLDKGKQKELELAQKRKEASKQVLGKNLIKTVVSKPVEKEKKQKDNFKQVVSSYEDKTKPKIKKPLFEPITIILVLLLVLLVVILGAVFLFKEELVNFFNNLFG